MTEPPSGPDDVQTEGFPAVPEFRPAAENEEPTRAVDRCLGQLDRKPVKSFGGEAIVVTAMAVSDLRATLRPLGLVGEAASLGRFDTAIAAFAPERDAGRRRRTAVEWLKRVDPPVDALMGDLEALVREVPDVSGLRPPEWETLGAIYGRAHKTILQLGDFLRAGQIRMAELTGQIEDAMKKNAADDLATQLRRKRDEVERRTHLLRIVRARTAEYLAEVRKAAAARTVFDIELTVLSTRALPAWEAVLMAFGEEAREAGIGRGPIDMAPILEANAALRRNIKSSLEAAAALRAACGAAEAHDPGDLAELEIRIMAAGNAAEHGA